MKPAEARRLAQAHTLPELTEAIAQLSEERDPAFEVRGEDAGEKLTHCLLASRIRQKVDDGVDLRAAYRDVMAEVRGVLTNE